MKIAAILNKNNLLNCGFVVVLIIMIFAGSMQKATICDDCKVLIALEFAHSPGEAQDLIFKNKCSVVSKSLHEDVQCNTLFDNFFLLSYTALFIFSFCILWSHISSKRIPGVWWIILITPGICDLIENNYIMLYTSGSLPSQAFYYMYFWVVRIKWAIAIPFALKVLAVFIYLTLALISVSIAWLDGMLMKMHRPIRTI